MFPSSIFLNAYRFSSDELKKMQWLKELFMTNKYRFDPDRFPEVYYDDHNKINNLNHDIDNNNLNPDYFGVYIYPFLSKEICSQSQEGVIILFKDRIEKYCARTGLNEADVRFKILMHELGHWLSHWSVSTTNGIPNTRWIYGYHISRNRTKEALAQLISYWACDGDPNHEKVLYELSPKNEAGLVDPTQVYGGYINLTGIQKSIILKKLSELRGYWVLNDDAMFDFLSSSHFSMEEWIKEQYNKNDLMDKKIEEQINEGNATCASVLIDNIEIMTKLVELGVIQIDPVFIKVK